MKKLYLLLFILPFLSSCGSLDYENIDVDGQKEKALNVYSNQEGNSISQKEFKTKTHNQELQFHYFRHFEKKEGQWFLENRLLKRVDTLTIDHQRLVMLLRNLTSKKLDSNAPIWISYGFTDDYLSKNKYISPYVATEKPKMDNRYFLKLNKKFPSVIFLQFFEEGIGLQNNPNHPQEYAFQDKNNLLRKTIFKHAANYGASAIIKPNGEILILNGENISAEHLLNTYLPEKTWNKFFGKKHK